MQPTKKYFIDTLEEANNVYIREFPGGNITSKWFREYLKENTEYSETHYMKLFGTFDRLKKNINFDKIREDLNIIKNITGESNKKKYFISAIIQGEEINKNFMDSVLSYCNHQNAELILLTMRGVVLDSYYGKDILEKYGQYFATEVIFNNSLLAKDFILSPQMIKPTTGLNRFGQKKFSLIISSPKQFLQPVPTKKNSLPHLLYTTGTVCSPNYQFNRQGMLADQDNTLGGLIVEIFDEDRFFIRNVVADKQQGMYSLDTYYRGNNVPKKAIVEAVVCGDIHWGEEDPTAISATKDLLNLIKPKSVLWHDTFDGRSVSHHIDNDMIARIQRKGYQKTLLEELNYLADKLEEWISEFKNQKIYIVPSNHDYFVERYLTQRRFIHDECNIVLACKLFVAMSEGYNPIEWWLREERGLNLKNVIFLKTDESFELNGIELNVHGHTGNNGGRGSVVSLETAYGSVVAGHSHSPQIFREVTIAGCLCNLYQSYNIGGSSWIQGNVIIYKGGVRQSVLIIDGQYKI